MLYIFDSLLKEILGHVARKETLASVWKALCVIIKGQGYKSSVLFNKHKEGINDHDSALHQDEGICK
jgi:hypothetical protein